MKLDPASARDFSDARMFDFHRGLGGMNRRMRQNVLAALDRNLKARFSPADRSRTSHIVLGELLVRDSQFTAAMEQYREAVRSDSNSIGGRLGLSVVLSQMRQYPEAKAEARAALKLAPNDADVHYRLSSVLVLAGNPEAAIPELRQAVNLQPNSSRNRTGLAVAYATSVGAFEAADKEFQEALKLDPQNATLMADIEYVGRFRAQWLRPGVAASRQRNTHSFRQ